MATACLFLAGKTEDTPRSLHRISEHMFEAFCVELSPMSTDAAKARWQNTVRLLACCYLLSLRVCFYRAMLKAQHLQLVTSLLSTQAYQENFKAAVLAAERSLLFTLGFNFSIIIPQKCLLHPVQGIATILDSAIEKACASAPPGLDLQKAHVQQAAYDVCNDR